MSLEQFFGAVCATPCAAPEEMQSSGRPSARCEPAADTARKRCRIGGELLDERKYLGALRRRKLDKGLPQPQTLHGFAGRKTERGADFRSRCAIFHPVPSRQLFPRRQQTSRKSFAKSMPRKISASKLCRQSCATELSRR